MGGRNHQAPSRSAEEIVASAARGRKSSPDRPREEAGGPAGKRRKTIPPSPNQVVLENADENGAGASNSQRTTANALQHERPPNPKQKEKRKSVPDVLVDLFTKSSAQRSTIAGQVLGSLQNAQERANSTAADIGRHFSHLREEGLQTREMLLTELRESREVFSKCLKTLEIIATRNASGNNDNAADEDSQLILKAKLVGDLVKYLTCIQFLDLEKGIGLFSNTNTNSATLIEAATLVQGTSSAVELLQQQVPDKRRVDGTKMSVAASACRAQSRIHDALRKSLIRSFEAGLPSTHVLNPANGATEAERTIAAKDLFDKGTFKFDESLSNAWRSAYRAAIMEARATAESIGADLQERLIEFQDNASLPLVPEFNPQSRVLVMSLYSQAFVSMKLTKFLQITGKALGPRMNKSHGPSWAKEVFFLNDALKRMNARIDTTPELNLDEDPVLLRLVHGCQEISDMEEHALREMINKALEE